MIAGDEAIVLRIAPYSNTSRFVVWLCREHGRVTTLIRGSQRPKSFHLGQFDLFYTCGLRFYERETEHVHAFRECWPIAPRPHLRADWRACAMASYCADLAARAIQPDTPVEPLYDALAAALDAMNSADRARSAAHWFEMRALDFLGHRPHLEGCIGCRTPLGPNAPAARFSVARGGVVCARCVEADHESGGMIVAPDTLALLGLWQRADDLATLRTTRCSPAQWASLAGVLGAFLRYHLNLPLPSRDLALEAAGTPAA